MIESILFTSVNWSSAYLDFYPYRSAINQLKPAIIYNNGNNVQIYEKDKQGKEQLIYNGKIH